MPKVKPGSREALLSRKRAIRLAPWQEILDNPAVSLAGRQAFPAYRRWMIVAVLQAARAWHTILPSVSVLWKRA